MNISKTAEYAGYALGTLLIIFLIGYAWTQYRAQDNQNAAIVSSLKSACPKSSWTIQPYGTTTKFALFVCTGGEDLTIK